MIDLAERHPAVREIAQFFDYGHLPPGPLRDTSHACHNLAVEMLTSLPDGPELTFGLRQLLLAKDAFVRQALVAQRTGA